MSTRDELRGLEDRVLRLEATLDMLVRVMLRDGVSVPTEPDSDVLDRTVGRTAELMGYTPKQHAVMQMLLRGYGTEEMARFLEVTPSTVKTHIRGIMKHSGVRTRAQIVMSYGAVMGAVGDTEYESFAGLPKDWAEHPERYEAVTKMLRVKAR